MTKQAKIKSTAIALAAATGIFSGAALALSPVALTDTDGDGVISAEEITAAREAHRAAVLSEFDTDGNGELSRNERRAMQDARYEESLVKFDADGDGELSREERRAAKQDRRAQTEAMLDVNGDGEVSAEESAGYDAVKSERGGKHRKHAKGGRDGGKRGNSDES